MDKYRVIVSEEARRQLGNCVLFIAKENMEAAQHLRQRLIDGIRSLSEMPARYPFFNETYIPANKYHKLFVENWYLLLYQIRDTTVYVDYVVDCRQDYQWLIH
jgi:plasmid stabilization system protein ParE